MPRHFSDHPTYPLRALQIWQILISCAHQRQTLTYALLAEKVGVGVPIAVANPLYCIQHWCLENGLPKLSTLVVNTDVGRPGRGANSADVDREREAIFAVNWYDIVPPTLEELEVAWNTHRAKSSA